MELIVVACNKLMSNARARSRVLGLSQRMKAFKSVSIARTWPRVLLRPDEAPRLSKKMMTT